MENWIKLSLPHKSGTEMKYIEQAFADDWFVPLGPNVDEFERRLSEFVGGCGPFGRNGGNPSWACYAGGTARRRSDMPVTDLRRLCQSYKILRSKTGIRG